MSNILYLQPYLPIIPNIRFFPGLLSARCGPQRPIFSPYNDGRKIMEGFNFMSMVLKLIKGRMFGLFTNIRNNRNNRPNIRFIDQIRKNLNNQLDLRFEKILGIIGQIFENRVIF
jgi:hypothetical protein